jgi:LPS export ABC transporter protein LptC
MRKMARRAALALAALLAGCGPGAGGNATESPPAATPSPVPIHVETQGDAQHPATFSESEHNRRVYLITAKSSVGDRLGDGSFIVALSTPHVTFFDREGKTLIGDSPKAVVTERNKTILMSGGVKARTQDGAVLTCDTLAYDGHTERVHGQGNVVLLSSRGDRLTGDTIDGDIRLNHVTVNAAK